MVLLLNLNIHPSIGVELVPTLGDGTLELLVLFRELFVTLDQDVDPMKTLEDRVEYLPEAVEHEQVHENIDQISDQFEHNSDESKGNSDESKGGHVENVEKG